MLFHPRVISRITANAAHAVPEVHATILTDWAATIESRAIFQQNEVALHAHFTKNILMGVLGYVGFGNHDEWTLQHEQHVGAGAVDVALGRFTSDSAEIIAPFELKPAKLRDLDAVMPGRKKSPVQQAWEYAMDAPGARWVLVSNYLEIRLYAVGYGRAVYEQWRMRDLVNPEEYARFHTLLRADNLLGGYTQQLLSDSETVQEEITNSLYTDYRTLRANLFRQLRAAHPEKAARDVLRVSQTILDRVLFIAFAEDTGLLPTRTLDQTYAQQNPFAPVPIWTNFLGLFRAIDKGRVVEIDGTRMEIPAYNGGLFKEDEELAALEVSDEICESFRAIGRYEFNRDVSVEVLGHILEQSISDIEELSAAANDEEFDDRLSRRRSEGVYYTPSFVTRHIVENTLGLFLEARKLALGYENLPELSDEDYASIELIRRGRNKNEVRYNNNVARHVEFWNSYKKALSEVTVLDPACGSGAFLIAAFDFLLNEGRLLNAELTNLRGGQQELFRWDTHILRHNLFGVDINSESIEITKLSLWLKTANPREPLTYLDDVIRVGNSVVADSSLARDAFAWRDLSGGTFDVVITNPPYVSSLSLARNTSEQIRKHWKTQFEAATGAYDLYVLFMELAIRLTRANGYIGLITPNKYVAAPYGGGIRELIRTYTQFCGLLDISRDRVFQDPSVYPVVSIFKKSTNNNIPTDYLERDTKTGRVRVLRRVHPRDLDALPERMFSLLTSHHGADLSAILARTVRLSEVAEVNATSTAAEADELSKLIAETTPGSTMLVNTGTIDRFSPLWGIVPLVSQRKTFIRPAVDLRNVKLSPHRQHIYSSPKIIFAKMALRPEAFLDSAGDYCSINTNCVFDADLPLEYLIGVLNSKALAFIYDQFFGALRMSGGYLQFQAPQLRALPIPSADEATVRRLSDQVVIINALAADLLRIKREFIGLLIDDLELDQPTRKLARFELLTWKQFVTEIERQDAKLTGGSREDWHHRFEKKSAELAAISRQISAIDDVIDNAVCGAYGIDPPN